MIDRKAVIGRIKLKANTMRQMMRLADDMEQTDEVVDPSVPEPYVSYTVQPRMAVGQ